MNFKKNTPKFSKSQSKLSRGLLRDVAKGHTRLSKPAIDFIAFLTQFVDFDGRINMDLDIARRELNLDRRVFNRVLSELKTATVNGKNLLIYESGHFMSNFHTSSNGETTYQKYIPVILSDEVRNLTKKQTLLFYYILTCNVRNQSTKIAIENLYKNELHDEEFGMWIYDDYKSVAEDLFKLFDKNLIELRIPKGFFGFEDLNNMDPKYKDRFHEVCEYVDDKKKRTSPKKKQKHKIGLKINTKLFNQQVIKNKSSEMEIRLLAERYHMYHEEMQEKTINTMIDWKNGLIEKFGEEGLVIYRKTLEKYFEEKHEYIIYYDLHDNAVNYFVDFYLLEEIKNVIVKKARAEIKSAQKNNLSNFVGYFTKNSSDEHKILIDQDIRKLYEEGANQKTFNELSKDIELLYKEHENVVKQAFIKECENQEFIPSYDQFKKINIREYINGLANDKLLSKNKYLDERADELKEIVSFFKKKKRPSHKLNMEKQKASGENVELLRTNWLENDRFDA
ncbi:hypothetical protein [Aquibacillus sediminis]|uniref:hypothetical protein n=1 Tax=Aquibacillus sediminis TaxID=2574734 RepID=UPI001108DE8C|nr:hypothetical protein [Aquibacillus sediminis]